MTSSPTAAPTTGTPTESPTAEPTVRATHPPSGAPSTEDDRCNGVTCSNHGRCIDRSTGACSCDPGWDGLSCSRPLLELSIAGNTSECQGDPIRVITSMALAGIQTLSCAANRTQFQNKATLRLELKLPPSNNVTCVVKSSRMSEGVPLSSTLMLTLGRQYAETLFIGSADGVDDGDQNFSVTVDCLSGDPRYDKASASIDAVNQNVDYPSITWLEPSVVPYIGAQVTIRGQNFQAFDQISVFVGNRLVSGPPRFRIVRSCSSSYACTHVHMHGTRLHLDHEGEILASVHLP